MHQKLGGLCPKNETKCRYCGSTGEMPLFVSVVDCDCMKLLGSFTVSEVEEALNSPTLFFLKANLN